MSTPGSKGHCTMAPGLLITLRVLGALAMDDACWWRFLPLIEKLGEFHHTRYYQVLIHEHNQKTKATERVHHGGSSILSLQWPARRILSWMSFYDSTEGIMLIDATIFLGRLDWVKRLGDLLCTDMQYKCSNITHIYIHYVRLYHTACIYCLFN